jgi:hypothetical protein
MKYIRLHADRDGESHFEQATLELNEADYRPPAPLAFLSHMFPSDGLQFLRLPPGWKAESISPPSREFVICLQGQLELTASDGEKRTFGPGDRVLVEDMHGKGHGIRVQGASEFVAAVVPIS